ncbi:stage V sporulation protein E [Virgibacillus pantothenticus]|uniref:Stage V sporulation protein E n=1 Tax=Virgibacillus pantothenticus TaxID=1473 RepID=A0A0L0QN90_VIRPA|nr:MULTISPECIES: stage V sporulation protein E [Virgibacillus]API93799.1 stage V sporulation protein E [Virgibacillus sp. 6R]KNE20085.1 stage V sporulation protein E [Virgibacillus pantothenticus]MBS7429784.1 stage V sporulation protein E [Virgibacillus sp. 19R1-5]MBU8565122.1 stage V sporulation protein E [Virgibacillus pantothenticus]MBU8601068.1 stage V sporulation protein E [Virgibacillus pantothenticus]
MLVKKKSFTNGSPDYILIGVIISLLVIGVVMVYSSSFVWAEYKFNDAWFYVKRQLLFAGAGVGAMIFTMNLPYTTWKKYAKLILLLCFGLLFLVLIPGIGIVRGGAQSWIGIGAFSIQPSEFMKLGLIIFLAAYLSSYQKYITSFKKGFLPSILLIFSAFGLIMLQPDLGTGMVLVLTCMVMVFTAGARMSHFLGLGIIGIVGFIGLVLSAPYRISRITAFLNPWEDPLGDGFQIIQSLYAIGPGGLMGLGLGKSLQKYFYLPEPQTDFIFAILGEELGFIGGSAVIILFLLLLWRGIKVSLEAPDSFSRFLALGIVSMLAIQAMINISVVIGLIPVTGITLPFLSYGGSSLTLILCSVGILLNISKYTKI